MTAENEGAGATPEGDDPFAYLYRQQGGDGSTAPQPGTPRRSYNQVHAVGERQYGGPRTQQTTYGQQPNAHYAAPETMPGGRAAAQQPPDYGNGDGYRGGHGSGGGRSRNGLLVGAIAVVAAVVIGIGAAIYFNSGGSTNSNAGNSSSAGGAGEDKQQDKPGPQKVRKGKPIGKKKDAAALTLAGGAAPASDIPNAQAQNGTYVAGMNNTGASTTWTFDNVPKAGVYTLFVWYGVPGEDANSTLAVNGQPRQQPLNMGNFGGAEKGQWDKGWTRTYAYVDLEQGQNNFKISCEQGNQCNFNLDQVWLKAGKVQKP